MQNWLQFTGSVTFGTFRVFGAADPNWQKCEINKVRHWPDMQTGGYCDFCLIYHYIALMHQVKKGSFTGAK